MLTRLAIPFVALALLPAAGRAAEWPSWRGPSGDGVSPETDVPVRWSAADNIAWKAPIPGKGHSSPICWGDRVFVTSAVKRDKMRLLVAVDRLTGLVFELAKDFLALDAVTPVEFVNPLLDIAA